jgi:hypothetical protein
MNGTTAEEKVMMIAVLGRGLQFGEFFDASAHSPLIILSLYSVKY